MKVIEIQEAVIRRLKQETQASLALVAQENGLSFHGLQKIRTGERKDPRFSTIARLAMYYRIRVTDCEDCAA